MTSRWDREAWTPAPATTAPSPVLGLPDGAHRAVGVTAIVAAVFLALCGAVTGVLLLLRPRAMHPEIGP